MSLIGRILRRDAATRKRGAAAEDLAAAYLGARGVRILARNYRLKGGEIDLVGELGGTLLFVEVRLRSRSDFGGAAASVTRSKQRRLMLAAHHYLQRHGERPCRFDCVLMDRLDPARIEWLRDAFSAD